MNAYDEQRFRTLISLAQASVKKTLDINRNPQLPSEVQHDYIDKYLLAELLTNEAIAASQNCLQILGLSAANLKTIRQWATSRSVSLRLKASEKCGFDREVKRDVANETSSAKLGSFASVTHKVVTTITEYFWNWSVEYELFLFQGTESEEKILLQKRAGSCVLKTSNNTTPRPQSSVFPSLDVNITWLLSKLGDDGLTPNFSIDRNPKTCHTPRRNPDINEALDYFTSFYEWNEKVKAHFSNLQPIEQNVTGYPFPQIGFIPVLPLFEKTKPTKGSKGKEIVSSGSIEKASSEILMFLDQVVSSAADVENYLAEQKRSFSQTFETLSKSYPEKAKIITMSEAKIITIVHHSSALCQQYSDSVNYIEDLLRKQLIKAIGKVLTPVDFQDYMVYHNRKIFKKMFVPKPFAYAIRLPNHYPEGLIGIEMKKDNGDIVEPIFTIAKHAQAKGLMKLPLNATTSISFGGDRYLHSYLTYKFSDSMGANVQLVSRARQFGCFILSLGTIGSHDLFLPKHTILMQSAEKLKIPLSLEEIPTPKQFRDAIESLSPEQQSFARAYRSMQLSGTLFGILVIQVKPQLEKLLNLPYEGLTKEIRLTQDLLELFIKYQIPSDLLSYDGPIEDDLEKKLARVKTNVSKIQKMIQDAKDIEAKEREEERQMERMTRMARFSLAMPFAEGGCEPVPDTSATSTAPQKHKKELASATLGIDEDYTNLPEILDKKFEELDTDNQLHATTISTQTPWYKKSVDGLLSLPVQSSLYEPELQTENNKAVDLLDALTRSGGLPVDFATLHVVIATTHSFDKTLLNTVIQSNQNPIEKVERSTLLLATTILDTSAEELLKPEFTETISEFSPALFLKDK